jgi:beta-lactamase regulating signal transducer with metallopeptidase domain
MILPYLLRLLCLCFASFFVLNVAASLLVRISSKFAFRFAESFTPPGAARLLLALRLLPFALAVLFVVVLCVPSYLWLEPPATAERVGVFCVALGFLGAATWLISIARTALALVASSRHLLLCRSAGQETVIAGNSSLVILVEAETPLLALSGLLRPRLLISHAVLRNLSAEELDAALSHELAHRVSRDNAKRFVLLLAPDILPFVRPLQSLERGWSRFAEWAADDQATSGDPRRALSLAAALVRVARMGSSRPLPYLSTSLLACDRELSARVDRLLRAMPIRGTALEPARHRLRTAGFLVAAALGALFVTQYVLSSVHELLELLVH